MIPGGAYLNERGSLTYSNVGTSMLPLLRQGKDLFIVEKKGAGRCRIGDVVLFRRLPGRYVLHRIVEVRENDYVLLGDHCVRREYGVTDEDILGVMTGYVRGGATHSVTERAYRRYTARILRGERARVARLRWQQTLRRALKRMVRKA